MRYGKAMAAGMMLAVLALVAAEAVAEAFPTGLSGQRIGGVIWQGTGDYGYIRPYELAKGRPHGGLGFSFDGPTEVTSVNF